MPTLLRALVLALLGASLASCGDDEGPGAGVVLAAAPPGAKIGKGTIKFAEDWRHVTYVTTEDGKARAWVNDKPGPPFDEVHAPYFIGDGGHIAYGARVGARWFPVVNGTKGESFDALKGPFVGPRRETVVFVGRRGAKEHVVVNGRLGDGWDGVDVFNLRAGAPQLGAVVPVTHQGDELLRTDPDIGPAFVDIESVALSKDGKRTTYVGISDEEQSLLVDGSRVATGEVVHTAGFYGEGVAYGLLRDKGKWAFWREGQPFRETIDIADVIHTAVSETGRYLLASESEISNNGGAMPLPPGTTVHGVMISANGMHTVWMTGGPSDKRTHVFLNSLEIGAHEGTVYLGQLSDFGRTAYAVRQLGGERIFLDGKPYLRARAEALAFGPTGKLAAVGKRAEGYVVVYGGQSARIAEPIFGSLRFDVDGTLRLGLRDGNRLLVFEMKAPR